MLSPEWTPARSTCSMIPGISTSRPSQTASTSISTPSRYLSTRSGFLPEISLATAAKVFRSDVLHDPGNQHVAPIADGVDLDLDAFEVLVDQERLLARDLLGDRGEGLQIGRAP